MLVPSIGRWVTPWTVVGSGMPAASRTVGATSMHVGELVADLAARRDAVAASCTIVPLRVPPQCEATCLVHWYGVSIACAQPIA